VEVDETYVGGVDESAKGRANEDKSIVMVAVEVLSPSGFGRVRLRQVPDASMESLLRFITNVVEQGSTIRTDGLLAYRGLPVHGYDHQINVIHGSGTPAHVSMPAVHRIASLLKRWLLGTHQGSVSGKHLDYYLDEFAFRFNRRSSRARGLLFYRLLQQALEVPPISYRGVVAARTPTNPNL